MKSDPIDPQSSNWDFRYAVGGVSSDGFIFGKVHIFCNGAQQCVLSSFGVFKSRKQLVEGLRAAALRWLTQRGSKEC